MVPRWLVVVYSAACVLSVPIAAAKDDPKNAATIYVGRITTVPAWHDIATDPVHVEFADAYIAAAAYARDLRGFFTDRLRLEAEAQAAYNFGSQSHWEFNVAVVPRWRDFPWNHRIETTVAFGIGLSIATELPPIEVELESETQEVLVFWMFEVTLGPPKSRWAASIRLHHRSGAFGFVAEEGGMNAPSIGIRYRF